jgi:uncharacterized protein (TIGR02466 family)
MNTNSDSQKKDGVRVLFPTLIYEAWYPSYETDKEKLISYVQKLQENDTEGQRISAQEYPSGYTSYYTRSNLFTDPLLADLVSFIHQCAGNFATQHHWDTKNFEPVINALFANINPKFSNHPDHMHPYSHISGVFYVKSEIGSPPLSFKDPRMGRWMMPPAADGTRAENTFHARIKAEAGKLLLFPSWLEHGVPQNKSDHERMSMSFNFEMRPIQKP